MSRSRATRPLIRYSLCPLRYSLRLTTTSPGLLTSAGFSDFLRRLAFRNSGLPLSEVMTAESSERGASGSAPSSVAGCAGTSARNLLDSSRLGAVFGSALSSAFAFSSKVSGADSITKRAASASSGSSMVMVTSARPRGGRFVVPLKMQSAMRSARSDLWLCSPRTQEMASTTLDLPQPLGPTMQVVPEPLKVTTVRSQNDLKPTISTFRSFSKMSPLVVNYSTAASTKLENKSKTAKASYSPRLGQKHAKRDDVSFLEGRVFGSIGRPYKGRLSKRLAGSRSEAQPPGARMAVREKTVTRCTVRVKPSATTCSYVASATR